MTPNYLAAVVRPAYSLGNWCVWQQPRLSCRLLIHNIPHLHRSLSLEVLISIVNPYVRTEAKIRQFGIEYESDSEDNLMRAQNFEYFHTSNENILFFFLFTEQDGQSTITSSSNCSILPTFTFDIEALF